jgi:ferredoxin
MLSEFAVVAGNHNFRPDKAERFRHRYYRKGKYIPDTIGQTGCVGCGRCVTACVANIANPVEVYNRLVEGS